DGGFPIINLRARAERGNTRSPRRSWPPRPASRSPGSQSRRLVRPPEAAGGSRRGKQGIDSARFQARFSFNYGGSQDPRFSSFEVAIREAEGRPSGHKNITSSFD